MAAPQIFATLLQRAREHIEHSLVYPNLSVASICRSVGISRSALYRLFEPLGGVAWYVQTRRLARIAILLADPEEQRSIADIAYAHGFIDTSHFSRAFCKAYGTAPKDLRARPMAASQLRSASGDAIDRLYRAWLHGARAIPE